jgi:hypothetical protein
VACALCLTVGCSKEPLPAVRQAGSISVSDLQPFLDMNIAVSPDARLKAQETLEGFFARRGSSMLGDTTVIIWPALFNASFPGPLKAQMRACLKVPAPVPRP